ncbi:hypothetical protein D3C81_1312170 [compost metagenome]
MVEGRHQVAAHFKQEHRQGQRGGQQQIALEHAQFVGVALGLCVFIADRAIKHAGGVTRLCDGGHQYGRRHIALHRGPFGGEVDAGRLHTGHRQQRALHTTDAGGAGHAFDFQLQRRGRGDLVTGLANGLHKGVARHVAVGLHAGALGGQVHTGLAHARHRCQRPLHPAHAGRAGHAFNHQIFHLPGARCLARSGRASHWLVSA